MPARKRTEELARPRERAGKDRIVDVTRLDADEVSMEYAYRLPKDDWCEEVQDLWNSYFTSGQRHLYQNSDLAWAWIVMGRLNEALTNPKTSAVMWHEVVGMVEGLMTTEVDRRKVRVELQPPKAKGPDDRVVGMNDYLSAFEGN